MIEDLNKYEDASSQCDKLFDLFDVVLDVSVIVNRRETLFKLKKTDYNSLHNLHTEFKPYKDMWYLA